MNFQVFLFLYYHIPERYTASRLSSDFLFFPYPTVRCLEFFNYLKTNTTLLTVSAAGGLFYLTSKFPAS